MRTGRRVLKRRAWVVILTTAVAATAGGYVALLRPVHYSAQSVLIVRSGASSSSPGSANEAESLASTYAGLIPQNQTILNAVAAKAGLDVPTVKDDLAVTVESGTSLLNITFGNGDRRVAIAGADAVSSVLTSASVPAALIPRGSLAVVRAATTAKSTNPGRTTSAILGGLLGLVLGVVLVGIWERADVRIDDPGTLAELGGFPVWRAQELTAVAANALVARWREQAQWNPPRIALVTVGPVAAADTKGLLEALQWADRMVWATSGNGEGPTVPRLKLDILRFSGRIIGSAEELALVDCGLSVLVVREGTRLREALGAVMELRDLGVRPVWAFLVGSGAPPPQRVRAQTFVPVARAAGSWQPGKRAVLPPGPRLPRGARPDTGGASAPATGDTG